MHEQIYQFLHKQGFKKGQRLPSIRSLAYEFQTSPQTVQKAFKKLHADKHVTPIPRKGIFWGHGLKLEPTLPRPSRKLFNELFIQFEKDLSSSLYDPSTPLPPLAELAKKYRCSTVTLSKILHAFVEDGTLERQGRAFIHSKRETPRNNNKVALLWACETNGVLKIETDRELSFFKHLQEQCALNNLELEIFGYEDRVSKGLFYRGRQVLSQRSPQLFQKHLGILVGTWHLFNVNALLLELPEKNYTSVWWENDTPPIRYHKLQKFFNLAYGEDHGVLLGKHLRKTFHKKCRFFSPFHRSKWSKDRLSGLQMACKNRLEIQPLVFDQYMNIWEIKDLFAKDASPQQKAHEWIFNQLDQAFGAAKEEVFPLFVGVNDESSALYLKYLRNRKLPIPQHIYSFDNSLTAFQHQFNSYEFNTAGMVRDMIFYLIHPSWEIFNKQIVLSPRGRILLRSTD